MPTRSTAVERVCDAIEQIPRNCICTWAWHPGAHLWKRTKAEDNCPWHASRRPQP